MIATFAKLRAPMAGLGKATINFSKSFDRLDPNRRMIILQQWMKQMRTAYDAADRENTCVIKAEDARNAEAIQLRA